jgi:hypothetical protein
MTAAMAKGLWLLYPLLPAWQSVGFALLGIRIVLMIHQGVDGT